MAARGVGALIRAAASATACAGPGRRRPLPRDQRLARGVQVSGYMALGAAPSVAIYAAVTMLRRPPGAADSNGCCRLPACRSSCLTISADRDLRLRLLMLLLMWRLLHLLSVSAVVASAVADEIRAPITVTILGGVALAWAVGIWFVAEPRRFARRGSRGAQGAGFPTPGLEHVAAMSSASGRSHSSGRPGSGGGNVLPAGGVADESRGRLGRDTERHPGAPARSSPAGCRPRHGGSSTSKNSSSSKLNMLAMMLDGTCFTRWL